LPEKGRGCGRAGFGVSTTRSCGCVAILLQRLCVDVEHLIEHRGWIRLLDLTVSTAI
jgi:hypothetical protein